MKTLAERLIEARNDLDVTQQQLADLVPCSQSTIGNLEAGLRESPRQIVAISRALGVNPAWLQEEKGDKYPIKGLTAKENFVIKNHRESTPEGKTFIEMASSTAPKIPDLGGDE